MNLLAYNNTRFQFSQNLSNWDSVYNLANAVFRMQVRTKAGDEQVLLDFMTGGSIDLITYDPASKIMTALTVSSRVRRISSGDYAWDYGFTAPGGDFIRIDGGTITFDDGVTR